MHSKIIKLGVPHYPTDVLKTLATIKISETRDVSASYIHDAICGASKILHEHLKHESTSIILRFIEKKEKHHRADLFEFFATTWYFEDCLISEQYKNILKTREVIDLLISINPIRFIERFGDIPDLLTAKIILSPEMHKCICDSELLKLIPDIDRLIVANFIKKSLLKTWLNLVEDLPISQMYEANVLLSSNYIHIYRDVQAILESQHTDTKINKVVHRKYVTVTIMAEQTRKSEKKSQIADFVNNPIFDKYLAKLIASFVA